MVGSGRPRARCYPCRVRSLVLLPLLGGCAVEPAAVRIDGADPPVVCVASDAAITVTGEGFLLRVVDAAQAVPRAAGPVVTLVRDGAIDGAPSDADGTRVVLGPDRGALEWVDAGTLRFRYTADLGVEAGAWDVEVADADGRVATLDRALVVAGPPRVDAVVPPGVCAEARSSALRLEGDGFLVLDGVGPTVTVGGVAHTPLVDGCVPLAGPSGGEVCTGLEVTLDPSAFAVGDLEVEVTNPSPADCAGPAPTPLRVDDPPAVGAVEPAAVCAGEGVTVRGERFVEGSVVRVEGVDAATTWVDAETLRAVLPEGIAAGPATVDVVTPDGCVAEPTGSVEVLPLPDVLFVDPPALWSGVAVEVTAWLGGSGAEVVAVTLTEDATGAGTALAFTWSEDDPGVVRAQVPAGLDPGGYHLAVETADGCGAGIEGVIAVTDALTVGVGAVEPAFGWVGDHTPVVVTALDPLPSGAVGFAPVPRLYLAPSDGAGVATAVGAVGYRDAAELVAVVPPGLLPGAYDLLVVNPDGGVGFLGGAYTATEVPPPVIDGVSPPGVSNQGDQPFTVTGSGFDGPTVTLACEEDGVVTEAAAAVDAWTATRIDATLPDPSFTQAICVVRVDNAAGPWARWAAMSVRNPAENLFPWEAGPELNLGRRAPAAVAGRTSSVSRYVWAMGGDAGDAGSPFDGLEVAAIGLYGDVDPWRVVPGVLPAARTLAAAARVEGFVYLVGGDEGAGPVASVWRARVLDPLDVPHLDGLGLADAGGGGLGPGTWTWRVSARFDAGDAANPGGESLPGDPISVTLPALPGGGAVTLRWTAVDGAVGYRVYRTPEADGAIGGEAWVADVGPELGWTDVGAVADPSRSPLPDGALGEWAGMPSLGSARSAPCLAVAEDPVPEPRTAYLYAAGGLAADGSALDGVEVLPITIESEDSQVPGTWRPAGVALSEARSACGAWTVSAELHSVVEVGESWVYLGGGIDEDGRATGAVDAGRVDAGGGLGDWAPITRMSPARAGFGVASASDFLYAFGGQGAAPSAGGVSGELTVAGLPDVRNWNSLGTSLLEDRFRVGSAQESSVILVVGGETDIDAASATVDVTHY